MTPKALIVEDYPDHLDLLMRFFCLWGWDVIAVQDPLTPVDVPLDVALIVLDRALPGVTGAAVLRNLRREGVTAPAVVVTGMPIDVAEDEFEGLGVVEIVSKDEAYDRLRYHAALARDGLETGGSDP